MLPPWTGLITHVSCDFNYVNLTVICCLVELVLDYLVLLFSNISALIPETEGVNLVTSMDCLIPTMVGVSLAHLRMRVCYYN